MELSARRRRRLHLAAGDTLERRSPAVRERRLAEMALHFQKAEAPDRALAYTMLVGDRAAAAFAHDDAARFYRTALDLAQQTGDRAREAEAYEKLGGLLTATIRYRAALDMLEPAARLFGEVRDRESEGRVVAQIGRVYFSIASPQEGIARLEPAVAALTADGSPSALAGLMSVLGKLYMVRGRYEDALACAERGADLARQAGQGGVLAESEITRGSALVQVGDWRAGLAALEAAVGTAERASDIFSVCRALQCAAEVYLVQGDLDRHRSALERALEVANRMHNDRQVASATSGLFVNAFIRGDWIAAHRHADRVLAVMEALGSTWHSTFHLVGLADLAVAEGEDERADRYLLECLEVSGPTGDAQTFQAAQEVLAEKDLRVGRPAQARARLEALLDDGAFQRDDTGRIIAAPTRLPGYLARYGPYHATGALPLLGWACLALGDTASVDMLTAAGIEGATGEGLRLLQGEWRGLEAVSAARQGRWSEAEASSVEALALQHAIPYPYGEGRLLYELGRVWASSGEPERARDYFERALAIFQRLGARPYATLAEAALGLPSPIGAPEG